MILLDQYPDSANLRGATLDYSNLINTNLAGAKFDTTSSLYDVVFSDNNINFEQLKKAVNFEVIQLRAFADSMTSDSVKSILNQKKFSI